MSLDPRTPVIIGVGHVVERPNENFDPAARLTPLDLMVRALGAAMADSGSTESRFDEVVAINSVGWQVADPARMLADRMGIDVSRTRKTPTGGDVPQRLIHDSSARILRGELDSVVLVGSEAIYTASRAQRSGVQLHWETQDESITSAEMTAAETVPFSENELAHGLVWPTEFYPLFENARRHRMGWTLAQQRERLGSLWQNFARVAATNPYAWITTAPTSEEISTPSATNRYVGFPYTKFLVANLPVDMGAAVILTSLEEARRRGVALDKMVFPYFGAQGHDHWHVSERMTLDDSVAMRQIWRALQEFGADADSIAHFDLYSCFPTVVQTAAEVIGIDPFDTARVPTVTGGLTFAGGPGNNYVTHSISTLVTKLRADPNSNGLITGIGWYATKHAWCIYGATPPPRAFTTRNVQSEVDATPKCVVRHDDADVTVESYVVMHSHDGTPKKLVISGRTSSGERILSNSRDSGLMNDFETLEMIGTVGRVLNGTFSN